ncbi:hypothetical protein [uncultured Fibrobacter sp.]|uniref:hypothetical protein n=1 Tax=uncultured Fibrobacter sp. TaxID=261512 RepID=UPI00280436B2|nr:hypothetical protein [uncultured Fibrobacter sp.]
MPERKSFLNKYKKVVWAAFKNNYIQSSTRRLPFIFFQIGNFFSQGKLIFKRSFSFFLKRNVSLQVELIFKTEISFSENEFFSQTAMLAYPWKLNFALNTVEAAVLLLLKAKRLAP